jgi:hypothetical protein
MKDVVDLVAYRQRRQQDLEDDVRREAETANEQVARLMVRLVANGDVELEPLGTDYVFAFSPDLAIAVGEAMATLGRKALKL